MKYIFPTILLLPIFVLILSMLPSKAKDITEGNKLYSQQKYDEALKQYAQAAKKVPDSDIVNFNIGVALYKKGDLKQVLNHFKKALLTEDKELKEKTHYNLGNVFYKTATQKKEMDLKTTISLLEQSLVEYAKALKLNKENENTKYNYEYVKNLLDKLKEQEQQQQKQQKNQPKPQVKPPEPQVKPPQVKPPEPKIKPPESQPEEKQAQPPKPKPEQPKQKEQPEEEKQPEKSEESQDKNEETQPQEELSDKKNDDKVGNGAGIGEPDEESPPSEKLSEKEALMFIEGYKQDEEPKGLLNVLQQKSRTRPVLKDW